MATLEEIEAERAERRAQLDAQRLEQEAFDMNALNEAEKEHGLSAIVRVRTKRYWPGLPTFAVLRLPSSTEYKRYQDMVNGRGDVKGDVRAACNALVDVCLLYPARDVFKQLAEKSASLPVDCTLATLREAEGVAVEEGKG